MAVSRKLLTRPPFHPPPVKYERWRCRPGSPRAKVRPIAPHPAQERADLGRRPFAGGPTGAAERDNTALDGLVSYETEATDGRRVSPLAAAPRKAAQRRQERPCPNPLAKPKTASAAFLGAWNAPPPCTPHLSGLAGRGCFAPPMVHKLHRHTVGAFASALKGALRPLPCPWICGPWVPPLHRVRRDSPSVAENLDRK